MKMHRHKLTYAEIVTLGLVGAGVIFLSVLSLHDRPTEGYDKKKQAAIKTAEAYAAIKSYRMQSGLGIDTLDDPQESGMIGVDKSPITTDVGELESKLTSVNPNWSAVVIDNLIQANVKPGDGVVIGMTGSFPALNTAVIIAVETFGAIPIWIISEGSSNWGANIPQLTWLDMEKILHEKGLVQGKAIASSLGGANNAGGGLTHEGREILRHAIAANQVPLIEKLPLSASIEEQLAAYKKNAGSHKISLYINVGGGLGSLGTSRVGGVLKPGLNNVRTYLEIKEEPVQGNVAYYLSQGVPVLNLLNIVPLARSAGLPIAPGAIPVPGIGPVFSKPAYNVWINVFLLLAYCLLVMAVAFGFTESILKNPRKEEMI